MDDQVVEEQCSTVMEDSCQTVDEQVSIDEDHNDDVGDGYISGRCTLNRFRDSAIEMVNHKFLLIQSINLWWWEVGDPISQNRSISLLQQNSEATPEVVDRLALFLSRVPGKRRAKFLDLPLPHTVPPTKSFR